MIHSTWTSVRQEYWAVQAYKDKYWVKIPLSRHWPLAQSLRVAYRTRQGLIILMADDSEEDAFFVKRALDISGVRYFFHAVLDGSEAISYLRGEPPYDDRKKFLFPNVLLCDLKMPKMDGYGLLRWLQAHPECKVIPTIVFTSSALESDVHESYVLGANAFMVKPHSLDELSHLMQALLSFWSLCQVPVPPKGERCS